MFGYMESPRAGPITWIDPALLVVMPQRVEPMGGLEPPTGCLRMKGQGPQKAEIYAFSAS
jgi:hypothetical protein